MKNWVRRIVLSVLALLLVVAVAATGWRAYRQHQYEALLTQHSPNAIRDARYVSIGGEPQWVSIRGDNRQNPVILFVHGGAGDAQSGLPMFYREWEHDFTVVQWDQRGAGLTFSANTKLTPDVTRDRLVQDGVEVAEYVRRTLGVDRVALVGHSWGSYLGVHIVKARPDLFSAYIGTGQVADFAENNKAAYENILALARAAHDEKSVRKLEKAGHLDIATRNKYLTPSESEAGTGELMSVLTSPELSLRQAFDWLHGFINGGSPSVLRDSLLNIGCDFPVPFFLLDGEDDRIAPTQLAKNYYDCIEAPHKDIALLPGGHFAVWTDAFRKALVNVVRPVITAAK